MVDVARRLKVDLVLRSASLGGVTLALLTGGCALPPSHYSGDTQPRLAEAGDLHVVALPAAGQTELGRVTSVCERQAVPEGEFSGESLQQLTCSKELLVRVLKERAAVEGGTALAELLCVDIPEDFGPETDLCTALVLRRQVADKREGADKPGAGSAEMASQEPHAAHLAWDTDVSFAPTAAYQRGAERSAEAVDRLIAPRANEVVMGTVSATCEGCEPEMVLAGLRTVAGKLGARSLVGASCVLQDESWVCRGALARYEVDPNSPRRAAR